MVWPYPFFCEIYLERDLEWELQRTLTPTDSSDRKAGDRGFIPDVSHSIGHPRCPLR